ncbi:MAG TPA: DUF4416 domain-containing protein [Candidatus Omnitrophica bacterium]|nr:DUF4416 domain-containing protein [Candidatus Omnitrophota bacterium]
MGEPTRPLPVKLITGIIANDTALFTQAEKLLTKKFGPADITSTVFEFDLTDYYSKEMGDGLKRKFISFERLIPAERLPECKLAANRLEKKLSSNNDKRDINLDPGYITLSKLVLATTKNFAHRIYAGRGIFQEVTLYFKNNTFCAGRWTYPDYKTDSHIAFFNKVRNKYYEQIEKKYGSSQLYRCV